MRGQKMEDQFEFDTKPLGNLSKRKLGLFTIVLQTVSYLLLILTLMGWIAELISNVTKQVYGASRGWNLQEQLLGKDNIVVIRETLLLALRFTLFHRNEDIFIFFIQMYSFPYTHKKYTFSHLWSSGISNVHFGKLPQVIVVKKLDSVIIFLRRIFTTFKDFS